VVGLVGFLVQVTHMLLVGSDTPGAYHVTIMRASGHVTFHHLISFCLPSHMKHMTTPMPARTMAAAGDEPSALVCGYPTSSSSSSSSSCPTWRAHTGLVTLSLEISFKCPPLSLVWGDTHHPVVTPRHLPPKPRRSTAADDPLSQPASPALAFGRGAIGTITESAPVSPGDSGASSRVASPRSWGGGVSNKSWDYHQHQYQLQQQQQQQQMQPGASRASSLDIGGGSGLGGTFYVTCGGGGGSQYGGSSSIISSSSCYSPPGASPTPPFDPQHQHVVAPAATATAHWLLQGGNATAAAGGAVATATAATTTAPVAATAASNAAAAVAALHQVHWPGVVQSDMAATAGEEGGGLEGRLPLLVTGGDDGSLAVWDLRGRTLGECWMVVHPHTGTF
jgi:hypothetical protein